MSRRRGSTNALVVIYWRDIPAQVTAGSRTGGDKVLLHARFQHAIDRAAGVAGKTDTQSYVAEWRRVSEPLTGDPATTAAERAAELEAAHPSDVLEALVRGGGHMPATASNDDDAEPAVSPVPPAESERP
ncbi:MAG: virulence factor [Actinomycetota bacterium]